MQKVMKITVGKVENKGSKNSFFFDCNGKLYFVIFMRKEKGKFLNLGIFLFALFFVVEFAFIFGSSFLVLLVFRHQIIHVRFSFSELHFVHTFTSNQCKKALRLNMAVNCSEILLKSS